MSAARIKGTVKWYDPAKGYGFIEPEDGTRDCFVHASGVERSGLRGLDQGDHVEFELAEGKGGKMNAVDLQVLQKAASR